MKMLRNLAYTKERKLSFTLERSAELSVINHTMKKSIHKVQYTFSMLFSRADLRESMVFYDFFSRPMFARMFSLLVYLRGQCSSLKQEHLSYILIDSL